MPAAAPRTASILAAFAAIYLVWGSTFLAIRWAVDTIPPFSMMAIRCMLGGGILFAIARLRQRAPLPSRQQWLGALLTGSLFFVGCHGLLAWLEQDVPSGLAALCLATIPLFVPLLAWWLTGAGRPSARTAAALVGAFLGVAVLVSAQGAGGGLSASDAGLLLFTAFCWAAGTIATRIVPIPETPLMAAATSLLAGGVLLLALAVPLGELTEIEPGAVAARSVAGLLYLVLAGTVVTFAGYMWLLQYVAPTRVATYAFVNPPVAVLLGFLLAGEAVGAGSLLATAVIVTAVAVAVTDGHAA